jgi:hypothetical protein
MREFWGFIVCDLTKRPIKGRGPPCIGGPVRWRWEICIYIKGGEMERLFSCNICRLNLSFITAYRFVLRGFVFLVIRNIPTCTFKLEGRLRDQFLYGASAMDAFFEGLFVYPLQHLEHTVASITFILIKRHRFLSPKKPI